MSALATRPAPTLEQAAAIDQILDWLGRPGRQEFRLGGFAGTGKTVTVSALLDDLGERATVCAFTGKAVNVLRRKGIEEAQTIHSTIYNASCVKGVWHFELKDSGEVPGEVFVVDEASMISGWLYKDLCSYGRKILFVGDPGQLEPVGDDPYLMANPDVVLKTIHRQALQSPILRFAHWVREGRSVPGEHDEPGVRISRRRLTAAEMVECDQVICAYNRTRVKVNAEIRAALGRSGLVVPGEKLIVLKNDRGLGVFNGMMLTVHEVGAVCEDYVEVIATDDNDRLHEQMKIWKPGLLEEDTDDWPPKGVVKAAYGYCVTCHKSQGSEWDKLAVLDEPGAPWDRKRWRYTAITRAAKGLVYWW